MPLLKKPTRALTRSSLTRHVKMFFCVFAAYLLQMCVMPYFSVGGVTPSLLFPTIAVITVAFGKLRAFWAGAILGILLETMQPTVALLNLIMYPAASLICSVICADKTVQQLEYERSIGKAGRNITPFVRTPLCAFLLTLTYDTVNIAYIYLRGSEISAVSIGRGCMSVFLSTLITLVVMVPLRHFLGYRTRRVKVGKPQRYELAG